MQIVQVGRPGAAQDKAVVARLLHAAEIQRVLRPFGDDEPDHLPVEALARLQVGDERATIEVEDTPLVVRGSVDVVRPALRDQRRGRVERLEGPRVGPPALEDVVLHLAAQA